MSGRWCPKSTAHTHYFCTDEELVYEKQCPLLVQPTKCDLLAMQILQFVTRQPPLIPLLDLECSEDGSQSHPKIWHVSEHPVFHGGLLGTYWKSMARHTPVPRDTLEGDYLHLKNWAAIDENILQIKLKFLK